MKSWKQTGFLILLMMLLGLMTGCFNTTSVEEQIFENLEAVVDLEKDFKAQQVPLLELEQQEQAIYEDILELGLKEHNRIIELSNESIALAEERRELLNKERESIETAQTEFEKTDAMIEELDDGDLKEQAKSLYDLMVKRYDAHKKLYEKYLQGIDLDQDLYEMLQQENITLGELEPQIESINKTYEEVFTLNEEFNNYTKEYNDAKIKFYENAGLNIELEETEI